jgi:hypothetical protein
MHEPTAPTTVSNFEQPSAGPAPRTGKRSFGAVFDNSHLSKPAHGGSRPEVSNHGQDIAQIELGDGSLVDYDQCVDMKLLVYKRADGSKQHRKCPAPAKC